MMDQEFLKYFATQEDLTLMEHRLDKKLDDKFNIVLTILDGHSKIFERLDHERIV